jgi:hypothetical protein
LSFSSHALVAAMPAREQRQWLALAVDSGWTRAELDAQIKAARRGARAEEGAESEIPLGGPSTVSTGLLVDAVQSLLRNAQDAGENVICRREDVQRVRAALGDE